MKEGIFESHSNKKKILNKYADTFVSHRRIKAICTILLVQAFLPVIPTLYFALFVDKKGWFLLILIFLNAVILITIALAVKNRSFIRTVGDYNGRLGAKLVLYERTLDFRFCDHKVVNDDLDIDSADVMYTIDYSDIKEATFDGYLLALKGKGNIRLYKDISNYKKDPDLIPEVMDENDTFNIMLTFDENEEILSKLGEHIQIRKKEQDKVFFGNFISQQIADLPSAWKHPFYPIVQIVSILIEGAMLISVLSLFWSPFIGSSIFLNNSGYGLKLLIMVGLNAIERAFYRHCAAHGHEKDYRLKICDDVIELQHGDRRMGKNRTNKFVYTIKKEDIEKVYYEGNELVICGNGELKNYDSYESRWLSGISKERFDELIRYDGHTYRILMSYTDRKEIVKLIENNFGIKGK